MDTAKILIIDDESAIRELISYNVQKEGFQAIIAASGAEGLALARGDHPDLIVLDLMLPDISGTDICRILKSDVRTATIPIIMATAKTEDMDIVAGLELGADDYITKPFSPKVLLARIHSVLRRSAHTEKNEEIIKIKAVEINPEKHEILLDDSPILLSATEFSLLEYLARNPGRVFSRAQLINAIKGSSYPVTERSIDVQILSIRKKLGAHADILETVRGVGYRVTEKSSDEKTI